MTFLRQITANGQRPAWALKLDVANFFPSIHKATLAAILTRHLSHPELLWLTHTLLSHDPTTNYHFQSRDPSSPGPGSPHYPVPPHKSLFGKHNERGLPIGNLTSQFWGNVYLNDLDHFIKRTLQCQHYLRYVDDMVLLALDPETLRQWCAAIVAFLHDQLHLTLRPEMTTPFPVRQGVDFVGWRTWWNRRLPRRRTLGNLRMRLETFERTAVRPMWDGKARHIDLRRQDATGSIARLHAVLASYAGHVRHGAARRAWEALWQQYPWLAALFRRQDWALDVRWSPHRLAHLSRFQAQYGHVLRHTGDTCLVFFPYGRFLEFYGPQRLVAAPALGLHSRLLPRASYAFAAGFPVWLSGVYTSRAVRQGLIVVQFRQDLAPLHHRYTLRLPCSLWLPTTPGASGSSGAGHAP
jgi:RNA-directed DNA polymerase